MTGARIGRRCNIGQNVVISPDVVIGDNVKIQNNVSVYTGVVLEDDVFCGPSMVFTNVINPRSHVSRKHEYRPTLVKRGASLGANSHDRLRPHDWRATRSSARARSSRGTCPITRWSSAIPAAWPDGCVGAA